MNDIQSDRLNECRIKLCNIMKQKMNGAGVEAILIPSASSKMEEHIYYQDPNFYYLFGDSGPDCWGGMIINTCECILFVPNEYQMENYITAYGDKTEDWVINCNCMIRPIKDISNWIINKKIKIIHQLSNNPRIPELNLKNNLFSRKFQYCRNILSNALIESRITKTPSEIKILRYINNISSKAHNKIREQIINNEITHENDVECLFRYLVQKESRYKPILGYPCICASGSRSCIIHYTKNKYPLNRGEMILLDMGGRLNGYISDITQTIPIGGYSNNFHKLLYQIVLTVHNHIINELKSNINWPKMEIMCRQLLFKGLLPLLDSNKINNINYIDIMNDFMPHMLGHNIGLQVHDVGNLYKEYCKLKTGMVLAVEPGLYINKNSIKYIKPEIKNNLNYFGIRIESNIIIYDNYAENITSVNR